MTTINPINMRAEYERLFAYYRNSAVRVINDKHPFFCAEGTIIGYDHIGLVMKAFVSRKQFFVQPKDLKIINRM